MERQQTWSGCSLDASDWRQQYALHVFTFRELDVVSKFRTDLYLVDGQGTQEPVPGTRLYQTLEVAPGDFGSLEFLEAWGRAGVVQCEAKSGWKEGS